MTKKTYLFSFLVLGVLVLVLSGCGNTSPVDVEDDDTAEAVEESEAVDDASEVEDVVDNKDEEDDVINDTSEAQTIVKELEMDSFTAVEDGKFLPQFSVREITANKGDTVRIAVTVTSGTHDFKLDEFNVYSPTPTGKTTIIEFVASEAGEFIYYCSQPGHRAAGQWGTLIVLE